MTTINDLSKSLELWPYRLRGIDNLIHNSPLFKKKLESFKIGIVDTGIDRYHPCFAHAKIVAKDFSGSKNPMDELGHGTHCAAILVGNDKERYIGLTPNSKLYAAKVLGRHSKGPKYTEKAISEAIHWLTKNKVDIILITMGRKKDSTIIANQINLAINLGILIIASGGNHGGSLPLFPSSLPQVICVSALGKNGIPLPECYTGGLVDFFSPGETIISAGKSSTYCEMSGSSQAATIFCGLIAQSLES
ncbi:S8 family peptidase [Cellulophaga baltica]|uniref:S8 family peptidase n=1 Tax=Cellulophaga baltica TaxID=76594 RepID=UPI0037C6C49C